MTITLRYTSIDGVRSTRRYANLSKARRFAHLQIGAHPEIGRGYAVSGDGVGKVEVVEGTTLAELFPSAVEPARRGIYVDGIWIEAEDEDDHYDEAPRLHGAAFWTGCFTCGAGYGPIPF